MAAGRARLSADVWWVGLCVGGLGGARGGGGAPITWSSFASATIIVSSASPGRAGTGGIVTKRLRSCCSEPPTYLSIISGPETSVGGRRERPAARRAAMSDLPQPGGP